MSWIVEGIGNKLSESFETVSACCPGGNDAEEDQISRGLDMEDFTNMEEVWQADETTVHAVEQNAIEKEKEERKKDEETSAKSPPSSPVIPKSPEVDQMALEQELKRQRELQLLLPYTLYERLIGGEAQADTVLAQASQLCQQLEAEVDAQCMAVTCCLAAQREIAAMHELIAETLEGESVREQAFEMGKDQESKGAVGLSSLTEARFYHEMGKLCSAFRIPKMADAEKYLEKADSLFRAAEDVDYASVLGVLVLMAENLKAEKNDDGKNQKLAEIDEIITVWFKGSAPQAIQERLALLR